MIEYVKSKPDEYEMTNLFGAQDQVPELIKGHFQMSHEEWIRSGKSPSKAPRLLSTEEAAKMVEDHLREEASKLEATKFWKSRTAQAGTKGDQTKQERSEPPPNAHQRTHSCARSCRLLADA